MQHFQGLALAVVALLALLSSTPSAQPPRSDSTTMLLAAQKAWLLCMGVVIKRWAKRSQGTLTMPVALQLPAWAAGGKGHPT